MADKQTIEDKAAAMREYQQEHQHLVSLTEKLRAARLAKEAEDASVIEIVEPAAPVAKKKKRS